LCSLLYLKPFIRELVLSSNTSKEISVNSN
jgi:hypothetical protein